LKDSEDLLDAVRVLWDKDWSEEFRAWGVRLQGENPPARITREQAESYILALSAKVGSEKSPVVRRELAGLALKWLKAYDTRLLLELLAIAYQKDASDPVLPFMTWLAYEPKLAAYPKQELKWLSNAEKGDSLLTDYIIPRAMRRLVATGNADDLAGCVSFVG